MILKIISKRLPNRENLAGLVHNIFFTKWIFLGSFDIFSITIRNDVGKMLSFFCVFFFFHEIECCTVQYLSQPS